MARKTNQYPDESQGFWLHKKVKRTGASRTGTWPAQSMAMLAELAEDGPHAKVKRAHGAGLIGHRSTMQKPVTVALPRVALCSR